MDSSMSKQKMYLAVVGPIEAISKYFKLKVTLY